MTDPAAELSGNGEISAPLASVYQFDGVALRMIWPVGFALHYTKRISYLENAA